MQFEIINKFNDSQFNDLCELFKKEWWCHYRKPDDIRTLLDNSDLVIGMIDKASGRLIAFSRILTDFVYRSMIYDVIVAEEYRNKGIGKMLLQRLIVHPDLKNVEYIELQTQPELLDYYKQFGFDDKLVGRMKTMRIVNNKKV